MMKKGIAVAAIIILAIGILTPYGYADHCPMMKGGMVGTGMNENDSWQNTTPDKGPEEKK